MQHPVSPPPKYKSSGWKLVGSRPRKRPLERRPAQVGGLWVAQTPPCARGKPNTVGRCDQLWSHRSVGPHPAATELGNCWGIAVLASVASHLQPVGYALRAGLFGGQSQLGRRNRSAVPAGRGQTDRSLAVRLSAPCVPSLPVQLLAALLSPQPLRGRGSLAARKLPCAPRVLPPWAAHEEKLTPRQDLFARFHSGGFTTRTRALFFWSSGAGLTNVGINGVGRGGGGNEGQPNGARLTMLVLCVLWGWAFQVPCPQAGQRAHRSVNNHGFSLFAQLLAF